MAALTGGNVGVAAGSTIAGKVASISATSVIGNLSAESFTNDNAVITLGNALANGLASGAAIGGVIGGSQGILNSAITASIIQQYNDALNDRIENIVRK